MCSCFTAQKKGRLVVRGTLFLGVVLGVFVGCFWVFLLVCMGLLCVGGFSCFWVLGETLRIKQGRSRNIQVHEQHLVSAHRG